MRLSADAKTFAFYTPSSAGGHALYSREMLTALTAEARGRYQFELITTEDLEPQFYSDRYRVHPILPVLREKSTFPNRAAWAVNRVSHYARREWLFLNWLRRNEHIAGVHFQEWTPWLAAPLFRRVRQMGRKVFQTIHNIAPHTYPRAIPRWVVDGWLRSGCLQSDALFVLTRPLADKLSAFLGRNHPPIHVAPHGVWTLDEAFPIPQIKPRLSRKRLLFFGQIRQNKGLHLLLDAAASLSDYSITIAGSPQERVYFESQIVPRIKKLRDGGARIDLLDRFLPDNAVSELFASHSAVVMPYTDGFVAQSGVVFLALAHELPVVASEAGGLRELFEQFKVGVSFRETSPASIAAAVRALHEHPRPADIVREIRAAREHFSWEPAAQVSLAGYRRALEERSVADDCLVATASSL